MKMLLDDPRDFKRQYIDGDKEAIVSGSLRKGSLVHTLLLEPEMLSEDYVVLNTKQLSDNVIKILNKVFKYAVDTDTLDKSLIDYSTLILRLLEEENLYQNFKDDKRKPKDGEMLTGDQKRLNKIITTDTTDYYSKLVQSLNKTLVSAEELNIATRKATAVKESPFYELLKINHENTRTELELFSDKPATDGFMFKLKGIIDILHVDYENKHIYITDIKNTSKALQDFINSLNTYKYWLQCAVYKILVQQTLIPEDELEQWQITVRFLVIDGKNYIGLIPVSNPSMDKFTQEAKTSFRKVNWHITTSNYDTLYDYHFQLVTF